MTTASDIVQPALEKIGAHTRILSADPSLFEVGRSYLYSLLEELAADSVELGTTDTPVVLPTSLTTDISEKAGARQCLIDILAERLVSPAQVEMKPAYVTESGKAMSDMRRRFLNLDIPSITPSRLMARGQGATRGAFPETFFNGEKLDADTAT